MHHSFDDPAALAGTETERLALFARVRDELRIWLADFARDAGSAQAENEAAREGRD